MSCHFINVPSTRLVAGSESNAHVAGYVNMTSTTGENWYLSMHQEGDSLGGY